MSISIHNFVSYLYFRLCYLDIVYLSPEHWRSPCFGVLLLSWARIKTLWY